jgi:hypothetical protein
MEKIQVLVLGKHKAIMHTLERLINANEKWQATIAFTVTDACEILNNKKFGLILIGAGISEEENQEMKNFLATIDCLTPIVKHYGGGSGLLSAEIYGGLNR